MTNPKRLSISMVAASHDTVTASEIASFAAAVEQCGFHRLYLTDHYFHRAPTLHSGSAFAIVAAATQRIGLGYCSYIVPMRHPIVVAKELAFMDGLCEGRLLAGLAAGSSQEEFDALGIPFKTRGRRLDESIEVMRKLWEHDDVSHEGEFFAFESVTINPKPVQQPFPVWIGSWTGTRPAARRIVGTAAGWQASGLHATPEQAVVGWQRIESMCEEMGRDPASIGRSLVNLRVRVGTDRNSALDSLKPIWRHNEDQIIAGDPDTVISELSALFDSGFEEIAVLAPLDARDQLELLAEQILPAFQ